MREIKFRGYSKTIKLWFYGHYVRCDDDHYIYINISVLVDHETKEYENELERYAVDPETIGQFTGFTDRNDKEIYEGDVLYRYSELVYACGPLANRKSGEFKETNHTVQWDDENAYYTSPIMNLNHSYAKTFEIIGNIHDEN